MSLNLSLANDVVLNDDPTKDELRWVQSGLGEYHRERTNGEYSQPGVEIRLVLRDNDGYIVGGIEASTILRVMHLDVLWVAGEYRKLGYGRDLVLEAEKIGMEKGCLASQTMSFSFQAPGFYQKMGYDVLGIYDGYPDGIAEYVLMKKLHPRSEGDAGGQGAQRDRGARSLQLSAAATGEDLRVVHAGLMRYVNAHIGDESKVTGIRLVMRDASGQAIGGLLAYMTIRNLVIEQLWLDEAFRGQGLGRKLVMEAERIAMESDCIACQTFTFSFAAPGFFRKLGYESFAVSDGYPEPAEEIYLIKRFE